MHNIKIYQKDKKDVMTGRNTCIEVDGKMLEGVKRVTFDVAAGGIANISIEMIGKIEIEAQIDEDSLS